MLRSRRFALVAVATILGLSACGDAANTTAPADGPAVIVLGSGAKVGASEASPTANGGAADRAMMIGNITYLFDGTYPDLGATASSWTLPAGTVDAATVARIAKALGVSGEPRTLPADQGGGWMVGPADYSDATITVSADGMVSWWYSPAPTVQTGASGCAYPTKGADGASSEEAVAPPDAVSTTDAPDGTTGVVTDPIPPCAEPTPPEGVPTKSEAEAKAAQLMKDLGLDPAAYELTSYADQWSANVTAYLLVGGHRSALQFNVGYGAQGALQWASGTLATPQPSSDYPLVTPEEALSRLNDQTGIWGGYYGGVGIAGGVARDAVGPAEGAPVAAAGTSTGGGSSSASGGAAVAPLPPDSVPTDSILVDPMPTYVPEDITVHLSSVRLDLTMVWAADGTVWLLPAYTFTSTDGGEYTVIAVEDQYIQQPAPVTVDTTTPPTDTVVVTVPVDSVPVDTVVSPPVSDPTGTDPVTTDTFFTVTTDEAQVLVGLSADEATKVAEGNGWSLRVSTLDGEPQMLTDDLQSARVNVSVVGGVVTAIDSIG